MATISMVVLRIPANHQHPTKSGPVQTYSGAEARPGTVAGHTSGHPSQSLRQLASLAASILFSSCQAFQAATIGVAVTTASSNSNQYPLITLSHPQDNL